ncbi:MAG: hypothetical protein M3O90_10275, partial [Actinomycetota bacterium]|nr:hypothetical protein [Actinomycetota bacterium]
SMDLGRRLAAHREGRASRYTASRRPVELAAAWETGTATEARRLEARIKRLTRTEKLRLVATGRRSPGPWGLRPIKFLGHEPDGGS